MSSGGQKSWAAGLQVGRYVLQNVIARGGMAEIWRAQQPGPHDFARQVVIKRILTEGMTADFEQLFFDEAKVASQLNHPNIVQVLEFDEFEGTPYLVMESLDGDTLNGLMRKVAARGEALPPKLAVAIVLRCAQGLGSAHRKLGPDGKPLLVVHRDVSPQNIFVTRDGLVKLLDFGIARAVGRVTTTAVGLVRGKPHYMAPEQATGDAVAASDVFSLGVVAFELLTGRRLYGDVDDLEVFRQLVRGDLQTPGPMDVNPAVPADLDALVRKMMARRLEHRLFDGIECAEALEAWQRRHQVSMSDHALSQWVQSLEGVGSATVPIPAVTAALLVEASSPRDRGPGAVVASRAVPGPRPSAPPRSSSSATVVEVAVDPSQLHGGAAPIMVEPARRGAGSDPAAHVADPSRRSPGSDAAAGAAPVESARGALASQGAAPAAASSRRSPASDAAAREAALEPSRNSSGSDAGPRQGLASQGAARAAPPSPATIVEPSLRRPHSPETLVDGPLSPAVVAPAPSAPRASAPRPPRASAPTPAAPAPVMLPAAPARSSSRRLVVVLLALGALASVALIAVGLGRGVERAPTVTPPAPGPAVARVKEPEPALAAPVELKLSTKPSDALVEVDGLLIGHTPLSLKGREGDIVMVTMSAPGHLKMQRKVLLSRQLSELKFELEKARAVKSKPDLHELKDPYGY